PDRGPTAARTPRRHSPARRILHASVRQSNRQAAPRDRREGPGPDAVVSLARQHSRAAERDRAGRDPLRHRDVDGRRTLADPTSFPPATRSDDPDPGDPRTNSYRNSSRGRAWPGGGTVRRGSETGRSRVDPRIEDQSVQHRQAPLQDRNVLVTLANFSRPIV